MEAGGSTAAGKRKSTDVNEDPCLRDRSKARTTSDGESSLPPDSETVAHGILQAAAIVILARGEEDELSTLLVNLHDAANGNNSVMARFLNTPITIDGVDHDTLLHLAAKANFTDAVNEGQHPLSHRNYMSRLLAYPQSVSIKNSVWLTPLHHASSANDVIAMKNLIQKDALVEATTIGGYTPLQYAVQSSHPIKEETVMALLESGADPLVLCRPEGFSAIQWCVGSEDIPGQPSHKGQPVALETMLKNLCDKNLIQTDGARRIVLKPLRGV